MKNIEMINPTPSEIAHHLIDNEGREDYTIVILGKTGPTGKTWLCTVLKDHGFNAVEISEDIAYLVDYGLDERNHYYADHEQKLVTVILNEHFHV